MFLLASLAWSVVVTYAIWAHDRQRRAEQDLFAADALSRERVTTQHEAAETERVQLTLANALEIAYIQRPGKPLPPKPSSRDIQLPDDLEAHVMTWGDEWARDDERGSIRAKYLELHTGDDTDTWQRVRRAVGIGELP